MEREAVIGWGIGIGVLILAVFSVGGFMGDDVEKEVAAPRVSSNPTTSTTSTTSTAPKAVNFQQYNIDYMNDGIKKILVSKLGASGKTAFYLPATGYMNVSRGTKYGVAFAIQNVNPKVPDGNRFAYNFDVDPSLVGDCGVSVDEAQSWIERGWASSGMISGQWREDWNEWYDAMTIYFAFPADVEPCSVQYNFVITKDGSTYDSKNLLFNLV